MKVNFKRVCSMMLALVMVLSMVPVFANAASLALTDTTIGAETSTTGIGANGSWTVGSDGKSISGSVAGSKAFSYYLSASSTLTITNNKGGTPDTGITLDSLPFVLILAVCAGAVVLFVIKRRNSVEF